MVPATGEAPLALLGALLLPREAVAMAARMLLKDAAAAADLRGGLPRLLLKLPPLPATRLQAGCIVLLLPPYVAPLTGLLGGRGILVTGSGLPQPLLQREMLLRAESAAAAAAPPGACSIASKCAARASRSCATCWLSVYS